MKRILSTIAMAIIVCLLSISLIACGGGNEGSDNDSADIGGTDNGGNLSSDILKSNEEVISAIGDTFYFEIRVTDESGNKVKVIIANQSDSSYSLTEAGEEYTRKVGNKWVSYEKEGDRFVVSNDEVGVNATKYVVDAQLALYITNIAEQISYTSKTNTTVVGRPATKYEEKLVESGVGSIVETTTTVVIDNATGICLKRTVEIKATGTVTYSGSSGYEISAMKINDVNGVKAFFDAKASQIEG